MDSIITVKGVEYTVGDDELIIPGDEKGDAKVDEDGNLLGGVLNVHIKDPANSGGREYKLVTFKSESRRNPNRVYALTIDAARACGYTDSLAFLRRVPQVSSELGSPLLSVQVLKLACNSEEREMLIQIGRVTGNLKNRMVTMVTMRNIFKLMGARVIKSELDGFGFVEQQGL